MHALKKHDLFEADRYFNSCHGASIIEMPNHSLVVSYFAGSWEKAKDVGSYIQKKPIQYDNSHWTKPKLFLKVEKKSMGAVHFFVPPNKNEIWAFYNLMHGAGWSTCNTVRVIYRDGKWQPHDYLRRMIGWNNRGKILSLSNGEYLLPMFDELLGYKAYFRISKDGYHWKTYGPVKTKKGCLEPTVVEVKKGKLLCLLRTKEREIYSSWSFDYGRTWSKAAPIGIPNPDTQVELLKLPSGYIVLANNHSREKRAPLALYVSKDHGISWSAPLYIEEEHDVPKKWKTLVEFSYPCMIYGSDKKIHLVYTYCRKTIRYAIFDEEWLLSHIKWE